MRFPAWRFLLWIALSIIVAGCATQPPVSTRIAGPDLSRAGRFALKAEQFGKDPEAIQGGFTWNDNGMRLSLDLTNPFGSVLARVVVDRNGATLTRSNGEVLQAATPDALVELVLGQSVPVQGLRDWLRLSMNEQSLAAMSQISRDSEGRVQSFEHHGWRVQRSRFDALGPLLLVMNRQDQSKTISIRLVIDNP